MKLKPIKLGVQKMRENTTYYTYSVYRFKMSSTRNRKTWTTTDCKKLRRMYRSIRLSVNQIAIRLDRTYYATAKQAERMGLPTKREFGLIPRSRKAKK